MRVVTPTIFSTPSTNAKKYGMYAKYFKFYTKDMISKEPLPNFQLLGAQILYQKLSGEFSSLPLEKKIEIRDFAFGLLQTEQITLQPTIDKLASICGILACSMYL